MLRDLEEVLLAITDEGSREFMREAVRCYHAGAYRAAVVMAVAAGMDDLRRKLNEQASSGGAPVPAKTAAARIDATFKNQDAFESDLIDACEKDATIFEPAEAAKLRLLLKTRHLCAHPSGHIGTAEEAREVITSLVDLILSRPALFGMTAVLEILARLSNSLFFPNANQPTPTVVSEIQSLQPSLHRALAVRVVELILAEGAPPIFPSLLSQKRRNAIAFLVGMLGASHQTRVAVWGVVNKLVEGENTTVDALSVLSADPLGLPLAPQLTRDRAVALIRRHLNTAAARTTAGAWHSAALLKSDEKQEFVAMAAAALLGQMSERTGTEVSEMGVAEVEQMFFGKAAADAGSTTFDTSNGAVAAIQAMSPALASRMSLSHRAQYALGVAASSEGEPWHGREARRAVDGGLGARRDFLDSLVAWADQQPETLRGERLSWSQLIRMTLNAQRIDVLEKLLRVFVGHEAEQNAPTDAALEEAAAVSALATLTTTMLAARRAATKPPQFAPPLQ